MKRFSDLTEQEVLALAITNEEEDSRIYRSFAEGLRKDYAASAKMFDEMAEEEVRHRTMLYELYRTKFGEFLPLIRRQDVKGFVRHKPIWLVQPLGLDEVRKYAANMEYETARFYRKAAGSARDASVRQLLLELREESSCSGISGFDHCGGRVNELAQPVPFPPLGHTLQIGTYLHSFSVSVAGAAALMKNSSGFGREICCELFIAMICLRA